MNREFDTYCEWLGIEEKRRPLTNYQLLGLKPFEPLAQLIEDRAQQQHDKLVPYFKGEHALLAKRLAFEIESAKTCLLNPVTRAAYDAALHAREGTASCKHNQQKTPHHVLDPQPAASAAAQTSSPDKSDCYELRRIAIPDRCPGHMNVPKASEFKPAMKVDISRPKESPDRFLMACVLGATAVAVAVIVLLYLNGTWNDEPAFVPTKSRAAAPPGSTVPDKASRLREKNTAASLKKTKKFPAKQLSKHSRRQPIKPNPAQGSAPGENALNALPDRASDVSPDNSPKRQQPFAAPPQKDSHPPAYNGNKKSATVPPLSIDITLPSGTVLCESMLEVPDNWQKIYFPKDTNIYVATWPNGDVRGIFSLEDAKLNGYAVALHEAGHFQMVACYKRANLDGSMIQWQENGERLCYAEHKAGRKHGLFCLFSNDLPWLIQEWDKGIMQKEYIVKYLEEGTSVTPKDQMDDQDIAEYGIALSELAMFEAEFGKYESQLKQELAQWYRQEAYRLKRERVAKQTPEKRDRMLDDIYMRNKAKHEAFMRKRASIRGIK
ncbi:MAG: hypothetical protein GX594_19370 [Pirellulaceae bacterium]|nr:hypothetical protein [Pirellulaceae bacterium]